MRENTGIKQYHKSDIKLFFISGEQNKLEMNFIPILLLSEIILLDEWKNMQSCILIIIKLLI